uniref:Uncharacterized protein n=1 Tax=Escherichia phage ETEP102 TaxID=3117680 RepID=A0AAU6PXG7_9CAUD
MQTITFQYALHDIPPTYTSRSEASKAEMFPDLFFTCDYG